MADWLKRNVRNTLGSVTLPGNGSATGIGGATLFGTFTWDAPGTSLTTGTPSPEYSMFFTPNDTVNYNTAQNDTAVNVNKTSGLNVTPSTLNINIKLSAIDAAQCDVADTVALSRADTGAVTYSLGALSGDSIFGTNPSIDGASGIISYTPSDTKTAGQTATQIVTISTENYSNVTVTITFTVLPKTHVEIQGITPEDSVYDGNEHNGYDGTITIISEDDGQDKFSELVAADDIEYIYNGTFDDGTVYGPTSTPPATPGDYTLTIKVADDNEDFEGEKTINFTIDKADSSDLEVEPDSITIKVRQAAISPASYDIKTNVTLTPPSGCTTGNVTYQLDAFSGDGIFSTGPAVNSTTGILSYTPSATKSVGEEASQVIKITTDNYEDVFVTVIFEVIPKTAVTIGGLTGQDGQYDNSNPTATHNGYDGSELSITSNDDDSDLTSKLTNELEYIYNGELSDGTTYGPSTTPPTNPGEYTVTVKIPDSNTDYTGSVDIEFIIEKEGSPAAPTLDSTAVTNYGGSDGTITITDYDASLNYTYEYSDDDGTTWNDAIVNSANGKIENLPAGTYDVRVKETATIEPGAAATVTITQPRGITLIINKNGQPWTDHGTALGKAFTLKGSDGTSIPATANSAGALVNFNVTADGTYAVYADSSDIGLTVTLSSDDDSAKKAVDYYTVSFAIDGTGLTGNISATYGGANISSGAVVFGGGALVITAEGTDTTTDVNVYTWTGAGTTSASGNTLSISSLTEKVDATCAITGVNAGIGVSLEGLGALKYGDTVDGKAIFTLADEDGTFKYASAAPATFTFSFDSTKPEITEETDENQGETDDEVDDSEVEDEVSSDIDAESETDAEGDSSSDGESNAEEGTDSKDKTDANTGGEYSEDTDNEKDSTVSEEDGTPKNVEGATPGTDENNQVISRQSVNTVIGLQLLSSKNYSTGMLRSMSIEYVTSNVTGGDGTDNAETMGNETDDSDSGMDVKAATMQIGTFAANNITYQFDSSAFTVNGLGSSGLTAGTAVRRSNTIVEVPITGTITSMGTITLTVPSTIAKENVVNAQTDVPINGTATFTLTVSKASQSAPNVTANENHETNEHSIGNIDSTMEYSTDEGQTWILYDGSNLPDLTDNVEIWVRYEETNTHAASSSTILIFHEKGTLGGSASITGKPEVGQTLTVNTSKITGNLNRSTLRYQWQRDGVDISGATAITYIAAADDVNKTISCIVTSTAEYGSVTAPGVVVTVGKRDGGGNGGSSAGEETPDITSPPRIPYQPDPGSLQPEEEPAPAQPAESSTVVEKSLEEPETTNPVLPSETIKETTVYDFGNGSITITIIKDDGQDSIVAVADTKTAIEAILSPEELAQVAVGEHAEIKINIRHLIEELKEVPEADRISIESSIDKFATEIDDLKLGKYIDITMQYRIGGGEWIPITEAREEIELTIDIPTDLLRDDSTYFIMRCHSGYTVLLHDLDDAHETITIATKLFSTYAIVYTLQEAAQTVEEMNTEHKCWLCGFCPEPLGICIYIWLLILIAAGVAIYFIVKRKNSTEEKEDETSH